MQERRAIEDDLPKQFEAGFEKAKLIFYHLFSNQGLDFDQAGPWHKLEHGVLLPHSDDEGEDDVAMKILQTRKIICPQKITLLRIED